MKFKARLSASDLKALTVLSKKCRRSIIRMIANAHSGHPGGSLSSLDFLVLVYTQILSRTQEKIIISNGHVSAAVYAILAEINSIDLNELLTTFRQEGSPYEGHVNRNVPSILYNTGSLGIGPSVASGLALAEKLKKTGKHCYCLMGDGECDEGQVYEMINFANKHKLGNYTVFIDYNQVQLSGRTSDIMPLDIPGVFKNAGWKVIPCDGHDFESMWDALLQARKSPRPTVIIGKTTMGNGVYFIEKDGRELKSTWHGKAPTQKEVYQELSGSLAMGPEEKKILANFRKKIKWKSTKYKSPKPLTPQPRVKTGRPRILPAGEAAECRHAYGQTLLELAQLNPNLVALTADVASTTKTDYVQKQIRERHIEAGIAEQHLLSCAGGLSLNGIIPFASSMGAFLVNRGKDQIRLNDLNEANVKMVATHCGLSAGADGPTHQALDDLSTLAGLFHTLLIEAADPNQTDHIIRFIAAHYGNFYVRLGRHEIPVITKEDGTPFYDEKYQFRYGRADLLRRGKDLTLIASGSMTSQAVAVADKLQGKIATDVINVSTIKALDTAVIVRSLKKTGRLITLEDHNCDGGLATHVNALIGQNGLRVKLKNMGVAEYQTSGEAHGLYHQAGIGREDLKRECLALVKSNFKPASH